MGRGGCRWVNFSIKEGGIAHCPPILPNIPPLSLFLFTKKGCVRRLVPLFINPSSLTFSYFVYFYPLKTKL